MVATGTPMREAIYEMSRKGLGITAVVDEAGALVGCISDGDLRRLLAAEEAEAPQGGTSLLRRTAGASMTRNPQTISGDELAAAALQVMEEKRITSLFVCDAAGRLAGVVHVHDLWRLELF